jgi:hypothetical protein
MRTWPNPGSGVSTIVTLVDTDPGLSYTAALCCLGLATGDMLVGQKLYDFSGVLSPRIDSIISNGAPQGNKTRLLVLIMTC